MTNNHNDDTWDTRYEWKAVALLSIGFGLVGLDRFMIQPLFPVMMKDLNFDYQDIGLISGVLAIAWGVAAMFCGRLADKVGHRKVLIPAVVLFSLLAGFSGLATGLMSLLFIRALMGLAEGAFTPTSIVATLDASKPSRHGLNLGIQQNMVALIGLGLAPLIVTQLLAVVPSWRWVFILVSLPGFIVAYLMYRVMRDPSPRVAAEHTITHDARQHRWQDVFQYRNVPLNICGMFCWLTVVTVMGVFFPNYLVDHLGLTITEMGFVVSAIGFGGSAGNLVMPGLSDRFGRKPILALGVVVAVCALLALRYIGNSPLALFSLVFIVMFCVFSNVTLTVGPLTVESVPATLMATASGLVVGIGEVFGGGIVPAVAGFVAKHYGIEHILTLAAIGMSLGLIVAIFLKETAPIKQRVQS
ncbi:MAG: MFS transporter [Porticoccaceae bacterium]|nr:MFS transporter [Porticoccaceae bacterium]